MAQRFQYRLRAIFYATAIAALLCIMLPPLFRAVQRHLASKSRPPKIRYEIADDVKSRPPGRVEEAPATITPEAGSAARDAVFIQINITRVNGKRIDQNGDNMPPPLAESQ